MHQPTDYLALNSQLNIYDQDGQIQFDKDREAARQYFLQHVNPNTVFFHSLEEKLRYLVENEYYEEEFLAQYPENFIKSLYKRLYARRFRFSTFVGAYKFYTGYALKTFDGERYLERYEDRIAAVALYLARGDEKLARDLADEMINQRFQPATPTFLNAGKKQRGELVSCFPGDACVSLPDGSQRFIRDIREGDQVLTDDGSAHPVTGVMSRETSEGLRIIKLEGLDVPLRCTAEHPLLALTSREEHRLYPLRIESLIDRDGSDKYHAWIEAQYLSPGDSVVVERSGTPGAARMDCGKLVARIESIEHEAWTGTVYNLEVEERHTYVVEDVVVHNCYLIDIADDMNSIGRAINSSLQLSKRGGGVALNLTNLRAVNDPIKNIENQSSGIIPVMKLLENCFSYANQLGARQGAGAVYLNAHHLDIQDFLDCRREAADEKIRIKTLSLGVVIPDITFELAQRDEDMYLFSPYDVSKKYGKPFSQINITEVYRELVEDPNIRKSKMNARRFFQQLAEVQFESGYPYILFEDNANRANNVAGKIVMSNLCSEILQVSEASLINDRQEYEVLGKDISCNLGSLNVSQVMDGSDIGKTVESAIRALTTVSDLSDITTVPTIQSGNQRSHAVGLGQMNLHGFLARERIHYGSRESLDFTNMYFYLMAFHTVRASAKIAKETGVTFDGYEDSKYASGEYFEKYINGDWTPKTAKVRKLFEEHHLPGPDDWKRLASYVKKHGMYHQNLQAVAPTGSISYVNHATASIHPITSKIEVRKEGKMGMVCYPAAHMTNDNQQYYKDAYELGWKAVIDVYAEATKHVDQGLSMTLFFTEEATTRDINKAQIYAWKKGIKTIYYIRVKSAVLEGTDTEGCVSCAV